MSARVEQIVEGLQVTTATEISVAKLEQFYDRMYPRKAEYLKRNWRWLYRVGTFPTVPAPLVAILDDEVVGHAGLIPVTLRRGAEEHTAIWFVDFGVLPEHQRKGIGIALTRDWMSSCGLHVTFCNERSIGVFLKYGWEERFHTFNFKLPLRPERSGKLEGAGKQAAARVAGAALRIAWRARTLGVDKIETHPADGEHLARFANQQPGDKLHAARTPAYLSWRVAQHPGQDQHIVLSSRDGRCAALARVISEGSFKRLHLLSLRTEATDVNLLARFFGGIVRWSLTEGFDYVWLITSDAGVARVARRWFPIHNHARFACHANDTRGTEFLAGTDHFWECLDSDFDLSYH